jgi:hypothetical protein
VPCVTPTELLESVAVEHDEHATPGPAPPAPPAPDPLPIPVGAAGEGYVVRPAGRKIPRARVAERCRKYLAKVDLAVEGEGGSDTTFCAARIVWNDFGLDGADGYQIFEGYCATCKPP